MPSTKCRFVQSSKSRDSEGIISGTGDCPASQFAPRLITNGIRNRKQNREPAVHLNPGAVEKWSDVATGSQANGAVFPTQVDEETVSP